MENPGEFLKRERELRGGALEDVSEVTRISISLLGALERDDYDALPHPTYVRGFIRSYCRHLGLDENDAVLRYEVYLRDTREKETDAAGRELKPSLSSSAVMGVLLAVGVLVIILYYILSGGYEVEVELVEPAGRPVPEAAEGAVVGEKGAFEGAREAPVEEVEGVILDTIHTLELKASADVWIRVVMDDGDPVEVLLHDGESVNWEAKSVFFC